MAVAALGAVDAWVLDLAPGWQVAAAATAAAGILVGPGVPRPD